MHTTRYVIERGAAGLAGIQEGALSRGDAATQETLGRMGGGGIHRSVLVFGLPGSERNPLSHGPSHARPVGCQSVDLQEA